MRVAQARRLFGVMRDHQQAHAIGHQVFQQCFHCEGRVRIKSRCRFIEQQKAWTKNHGTQQGQPPTLARGKMADMGVEDAVAQQARSRVSKWLRTSSAHQPDSAATYTTSRRHAGPLNASREVFPIRTSPEFGIRSAIMRNTRLLPVPEAPDRTVH